MRIRRDDLVRWLEEQGCSFIAEVPGGLMFNAPGDDVFVVPDATADGWFYYDLVQFVLDKFYIVRGPRTPPLHP